MEKEKKNWTSAPLNDLISFVIGGDWGKAPEEDLGDDFTEALCIRGSELKNWREEKGSSAALRLIKKSSLEKRELQLGDILLEISGGGPDQPVGRTVIIDKHVLTQTPATPKVCTNFFRMVRLSDELNKNYVNYYLQYFYHSGEVVKCQGGSNNLRNLKFKEYSNIQIPVAPLPEQKRIVAKLDALFGHLDTLREKLDRIPELMKNFRQQVLTQAVTGKLTEEWRKGKELTGWSELKIEELVNSLKTDIRTGPFGSALKKSEHQYSGIPVWGIESIGKNGEFTGQNKIYVTKEKAAELKSFEVKGGDLIISRSGTVGEICILPNDVQYGLISTNLMKIVLNRDVINSKFFCWLIMGSPTIKNDLEKLCKGSTRLFITQTILKQLVFKVPSLEEQKEAIHQVSLIFKKIDVIEAQYQSLKEKIDSLPQAILAKAFKGELVAQNPNDEPAGVLLERIKGEKETFSKVQNFGKVKKGIATKTTYTPQKDLEDLEGRMVAEGGPNYRAKK